MEPSEATPAVNPVDLIEEITVPAEGMWQVMATCGKVILVSSMKRTSDHGGGVNQMKRLL